jgi:hypothetical protein
MADLPRGTVTFLFTDATANALALIKPSLAKNPLCPELDRRSPCGDRLDRRAHRHMRPFKVPRPGKRGS